MHEDLLGYLLGALEPHDMRRVADLLRHDPEARAELAKIEASLKPLEDSYEAPVRPSSDLVARTLSNLPPLPAHQPTLSPVGIQSSGQSSMSWLDWVSGSVAVAILLCLLLPTIAQGRFESRRTACQDQLRQFGTALTNFVTSNTQERLPAVSDHGPEAFAGIYAVRLSDAGLLNESMTRLCPSLDPPETSDNYQLVSVNDLHTASADRLREIQRSIGGHYTYTLGVMKQNRLTAPKFMGRSSFAVMSDASALSLSVAGAGGDAPQSNVAHSGLGINVLFEDGRVKFFSMQSLEAMPDHPLMNDLGQGEAGVDVNDASLAPSWGPPFVNANQQ